MEASQPTVIDPVALERLKRLGGGKLLRDMLDLFLEHTPVRMAAAAASFSQGDLAGVNQAAHSLKSSAANLGARTLRDYAEQVEHVAAGEQAGDLASLIAHLQEAFAQARAALEKERQGLQP
jgi:HPt (histidine-containing phosphotransfer) domain-containing protein